MTLEEGIELAQKGDVGAAISVGNYYWDKKDPVEAYDYYVIAAKQGASYGIMMAMYCASILVNADLLLNDTQAAIVHCQEGMHWASLVLTDKGDSVFSQKDKQAAADHYDVNVFDGGYSYYLLDNYQEAFNFSEKALDKQLPDIRLLRGVCLFNIAKTIDDNREAFDCLTSVFHPDNKNKESSISPLIAEAAFCLSIIYRNGLPGRFAANTEKALETLINVRNFISNETHKDALAKEINKYHQKLFGGYVYKG